jgi:hypothetical protein
MAHQQKLDDYYCDTISLMMPQSDSYRDTPPNQQIHQYGTIQPFVNKRELTPTIYSA